MTRSRAVGSETESDPIDTDVRFGTDYDGDHPDRTSEWDALRSKYLVPAQRRTPSTGRGVHHQALISRDVEATIRFYQDILGFPLTELFENRDYVGSTHFFFDIGNQNALAFFDFPGLDLEDYKEVHGGHHHLAISMTRQDWTATRDRLRAANIPFSEVGGTSLYTTGPDGERIELIAEPLGHMYGIDVLG